MQTKLASKDEEINSWRERAVSLEKKVAVLSRSFGDENKPLSDVKNLQQPVATKKVEICTDVEDKENDPRPRLSLGVAKKPILKKRQSLASVDQEENL